MRSIGQLHAARFGHAFRKTAHGAVKICVRFNIHSDAISYFSIVCAAAAALCFWQAGGNPWWLLLGPLFCYARLWCNMLDGMVALASDKASWRGEILNDFPDRISDVLIFAGVAHSGLNAVVSGYWAAIFAVLTAYIGLFGQAVGVQREFSGVMSKPWRMVTLHIGRVAHARLDALGRRKDPVRRSDRFGLDLHCRHRRLCANHRCAAQTHHAGARGEKIQRLT